jgi:hypothetical protein
MADAEKKLNIVLSAKDDASKVVQSIGTSFRNLARDAQMGSALILGSLTLSAKAAVQLGADMQSARVSFETFLGSGEKAGKLLAQLSDFAVKTPFDLPQVVDGTKRLLAYGIAANDIIPVFTTLGDLSSGNKVRLDQLVLAYGQVRAATRLTGAELRQFTEAGVPLLDALASELNKNGGAIQTFGGAAKGTSAKIASLNLSLQKQNNRLSEMSAKGKEGSATYKNLTLDIASNQSKLASLSGTTATYTKRVKVTAAEVKEMISDGAISFEQVDAALKKLNSEGGRFFQNMEAQSKTFNGVMSNTRDEFARFAISVLGFTKEGEIRKGSLFFYLQIGAEKMLTTLQYLRPIVQSFVDTFLQNQVAIMSVVGALIGLMVPLGMAFVGLIAPALAFAVAGAAIGSALMFFIKGIKEGNPLIILLASIIGTLAVIITATLIPAFVAAKVAAVTGAIATIAAFGPLIVAALVVGGTIAMLAHMWQTNFMHIRENTQAVIDYFRGPWLSNLKGWGEVIKNIVAVITMSFVNGFNRVRSAIDAVSSAIKKAISALSSFNGMGVSSKGGGGKSFQHGGFVSGAVHQAVPAVLHGGERVIPRTGVDVNGGGGGNSVTINFSGPVAMDSTDRVDELAKRIINILGRQNELAAKGLAI